jgi:hypothetical protein
MTEREAMQRVSALAARQSEEEDQPPGAWERAMEDERGVVDHMRRSLVPRAGSPAPDVKPRSPEVPSDGSQPSVERKLTPFQQRMLAISRGPTLPIDPQPIDPAIAAMTDPKERSGR